jgi:hypothetical protein
LLNFKKLNLSHAPSDHKKYKDIQMKYPFLLFIILYLIVCSFSLQAQQIGSFVEDESKLYAETKQVNQFFRRFNNEEGPDGVRYRIKSREYRNPETRNEYLEVLFDLQNESTDSTIKKDFIDFVNNDTTPYFLDFHADEWFAEVKTKFLYKNKPTYVTFFLELEQENLGYKWVITSIFFDEYAQIIGSIQNGEENFLHPMSHELDFMNFIRVFDEANKLNDYTKKGFSPDYLSIFLYEFKQGLFEYQTVMNLKFHFFQIPGWYFEMEKFNRDGYNSGWLISRITPLLPEEKTILMNYIYHD